MVEVVVAVVDDVVVAAVVVVVGIVEAVVVELASVAGGEPNKQRQFSQPLSKKYSA